MAPDFVMTEGGEAPLEQDRVCSTERCFPHEHWEGISPYRRAKASQTALLWRANPWSRISNTFNQLEAPFS